MIIWYPNEIYSGRSNVWVRDYILPTIPEEIENKPKWDWCYKFIPLLKDEERGIHLSVIKFK